MSAVSVERIMKNIYGATATGRIDNMSGGDNIPNLAPSQMGIQRPQPKVIYLDDENGNNINPMSMTGGSRKRKVSNKRKKSKACGNTKKTKGGKTEDVIIYASPEYINNDDLQKYISKFFMFYRVSHSPNSSIYIVPPTSELNNMISKRGNYKEGSIEMQKFVRDSDKIGYERYIFCTFGNNKTSDKYRIDPQLTSQSAYPNEAFGTIRRTNLRGEVYYMTCNNIKDKVKIHTEADKPKDGTDLTFIGRFNNGGYVFQGSLPGAPKETIAPKINKKKSNKVDKMKFGDSFGFNYFGNSMAGGAACSSLETLSAYDDLYNGDHDMAAEHFLRAAAKTGKLSEKYRNNGDLLYSAIYFALSEPSALNKNHIGKEEKGNIYKNFKPINRGSSFKQNVQSIINKMNNIYKSSVKNNSTKSFINAYKNLYKSNDINKMTADIMTGYYRNNDNKISSSLINDIKDSFEDYKTENNGVVSLIKNAFNNNPLPSAFGSEYMPLLSNYESFEKSMKNKDQYEDNNDYAAEIYAAKRGRPKKNKQKEEPQSEQPQNEQKETEINEEQNEQPPEEMVSNSSISEGESGDLDVDDNMMDSDEDNDNETINEDQEHKEDNIEDNTETTKQQEHTEDLTNDFISSFY